jgi:hypothetical protein
MLRLVFNYFKRQDLWEVSYIYPSRDYYAGKTKIESI